MTDVASNGIATIRRPSPRFDSVVAAHRSRKFREKPEPDRAPARWTRVEPPSADLTASAMAVELAGVHAERFERRVDLVERSGWSALSLFATDGSVTGCRRRRPRAARR